MSTMDDKVYIAPVLGSDKWDIGEFRINPSSHFIQLKIEDDFIDTIDSMKDDRRASQCSDLVSLLKTRNYNLLDSKGIDPISKELGFISEYDEEGCMSKIEIITNSIRMDDIQKIMSLQSDFLNSQVGWIPGKYIDNGTGDYSYPIKYGFSENYYNFRLVLDFVNKSSILDIQSLNDVVYNDSLDLNRVMSDLSIYESLVVRVGVRFTTSDSNDIVRMSEISFPYNEDISNNIEDKVYLEYIGRIIRLFPSSDVSECIISYCHLLGKFK